MSKMGRLTANKFWPFYLINISLGKIVTYVCIIYLHHFTYKFQVKSALVCFSTEINYWALSKLKRQKWKCHCLSLARHPGIPCMLEIGQKTWLLIYTDTCVEKVQEIQMILQVTASFCDMNQNILTEREKKKRKKKKKRLFPKFQLVTILHLQVMHDYVHGYCF